VIPVLEPFYLRQAGFGPAFAANIFDRQPALRPPLTLRFGRFSHTEVSNPIRFAPANRRRGLRDFIETNSPLFRRRAT